MPGLKKKDANGEDPYYIDSVGYKLIQKIDLLIGNTCFDSIDGDYMFLWQALSGKAGKDLGEMVGNYKSEADRINASKAAVRLYVPIPFWFNSATAGGHTGAALPVAAIPFQRDQSTRFPEKFERRHRKLRQRCDQPVHQQDRQDEDQRSRRQDTDQLGR